MLLLLLCSTHLNCFLQTTHSNGFSPDNSIKCAVKLHVAKRTFFVNNLPVCIFTWLLNVLSCRNCLPQKVQSVNDKKVSVIRVLVLVKITTRLNFVFSIILTERCAVTLTLTNHLSLNFHHPEWETFMHRLVIECHLNVHDVQDSKLGEAENLLRKSIKILVIDMFASGLVVVRVKLEVLGKLLWWSSNALCKLSTMKLKALDEL